MSLPDLPYSEPVRLHQVGAGLARTLEPDAATRERIARSLSLASLDELTADLELKPSPAGWRLTGVFAPSWAQTCGITLDPLPVELDEAFTVSFVEGGDVESDEIVVDIDDDAPDLIEGGRLDLGQAVVEQLALNLDPFPRKPGAEFVQPEEPAEISPFAVLKGLKTDDAD